MDIEQIRTYCLAKKGATEDLPFDEVTLVFKVMGKIFAATSLDTTACRINLKCDPDRALQLRASCPAITPGYHMNKKHWNTVYCTPEIKPELLKQLIDHSYELVVAGLSRKNQSILSSLP